MLLQLFIGLLAFFMVFFANALIMVNNPVKSVLSLMGCLICVAVYWLLLGAEFLSMVLIFVYVGAVMTLFLFTVMMMNESSYTSMNRFSACKMSVMGVFAFSLPLFVLLWCCYWDVSLFSFDSLLVDVWGYQSGYLTDFSIVLYQEYFWLLQVLALILVVPIVVSVGLVRRSRVSTVKTQISKEQLDVTVGDRLSLINNKAEKC